MGVLPLDTLVSLVRLHIYEAVTVEGYDLVDALYIADAIDSDVTASYVKMAFRQLKAQSELEYEIINNVTGDVSTGKVYITAKGIRSVEKDLSDDNSVVSAYQQSGLDGSSIPFVPSGIAPASDRIVSFSDNEQAAGRARKAVEALKQKIIETNDFPEDLAPFRDVVIDELGALQDLINKTVVRASIVLVFARRLLPWLADKAGGAAIGELAKRALAALIHWLT